MNRMDQHFPKILIFGQPFNSNSGGGITLSNLFEGWPKDKIAIIAHPSMLRNISYERCDRYYQVGQEECIWSFPFNLYKERYPSGEIGSFTKATSDLIQEKSKLRKLIADRIINPSVRWFGMTHRMSRTILSPRLKRWMNDFGPEIFYFQVSSLENILFVSEIIDFLGTPTIIHMMDDWPATIADGSFFRSYWVGLIDKEFRQLLKKTRIHLSIGREMSIEYKNRYGYDFIPFHNTIDLDKWSPCTKTDLELKDGEVKILFSGRIGTGIRQALFELASAVSIIRNAGTNVILYIQTTSNDLKTIQKLKRINSVVIRPPVAYADLPKLYSEADILVIANDFTPEGIRFLKFSMPTKAPEYMISGTPILVYSSDETAVFKLFNEHNCGYCIYKKDPREIAYGIDLLINNKDFRQQLSENAVAYARQHYDSVKIRKAFQELLIDATSTV